MPSAVQGQGGVQGGVGQAGGGQGVSQADPARPINTQISKYHIFYSFSVQGKIFY